MKVIFTDEALASLKEVLDFMLDVQQIPKSVVKRLHRELVEGALALERAPYRGQRESHLLDVPIE
ncbi:MAG TPA: hypothetical protein DCR93_01735 [Cytophagales bacterium]|nr:hypothetical protein [Cytophagales bacterium]HAP58273.1 hypothetical protein [Cytophagales bacterium]